MSVPNFPARSRRGARGLRAALAISLLLELLPGVRAIAAESEPIPDPNKVVRLPEIVITAKPILQETRFDSLGTLLTIIGRKQIDGMNALDLPSALRRLPGVVISRYNLVGSYGGGDGGAVYIRGLGSGRPGAEIGTLFDGVPRFVGVWTHPIMDALSLDSANGIEVSKSPQSVLQGNMAFGSVNMVPFRRIAPGYETAFQGAWGRYRTRSGEVRHGGRTGRFDYYLSAGQKRSDGQRDFAYGKTESIYGRAGVQLAPGWDWSLQVDHTGGSVQDPGSTDDPWPVDDPAFKVPTFDTDTELYLTTMQHRIGRASGVVKLYLEHGRMDWLLWDAPSFGQPPESFRGMTDYDNYGLRFHESVPAPWQVRMTLGFDQDFYGGKAWEVHASGNTFQREHFFRNRAPYATASRTIRLGMGASEGWQVTPSVGARYNDSRAFGSDWGWQAGAVAERGQTRFHIQRSRAFNLPGVYVATMYDGWNRPREWEDLRAEVLDHNEVGVRVGLCPRVGAEANAFYDEVRSAIRWVPPVIPPPPPFQAPRFDNSGRYVNRGVETSLTADVGASALFAGMTLMNPSPEDLPNAPPWSVDAGLNSRVTRALSLSVDASWSAAQTVLNPRFASPTDYDQPTARVARHFLLNARLAYALTHGGIQSEIYLAGENITDEEYAYRPGYPMPPMTWMSGAKITF